MYHTAMWVAYWNAPTITSLVESVFELYQWASFQVKEVSIMNSDQCSKFSKMMDGPS